MSFQVCDEVRPLIDVEGYTQVGIVQKFQVHTCGKRKNYIVVELIDKQRICTPCLDEDIVKLSVKFIEHYNKIKLVIK